MAQWRAETGVGSARQTKNLFRDTGQRHGS
jgi:hypothetical protein